MRIVVFTVDPHLKHTPWWQALLATPGVSAVLVCHKVTPGDMRSVARRFRKNVQKHGLVWVPYRVGMVGVGVLKRLKPRRPAEEHPAPSGVTVEDLETHDLHSAETIAAVRAFAPDLGVSLGAPVLKRALFSVPRRGTINMHLGRVPEFRGAPVGFWELMHGVTTVGATIHWIDDQLDTGPVLASAEAPIYDADSLADVEARAGELGSRLLASVLIGLQQGELPARTQTPAATPANRLPTLRQRAALGWRLWRRRARQRLSPRFLAKGALMLAAVYGYRPLRDLARSIRRRHPVRVFTFHRVTDLCRDGMTVNPRVFAEQIRYLARHHDFASLDDGLALIRSGARLRRPVAVLTFDDGYRSVIQMARPILDRAGATACCFVSTDFVGTDRRFAHDETSPVRDFMDVMGWEELVSLRRAGWCMESHTASHARLSACTGATLDHEVREPRRVLRERLGVAASVLGYPFGLREDFSDEAMDASVRAGYAAVFGNFKGENATGDSAMLLSRIDLGGSHAPLAWRMLSHGIDLARLRPAGPAPVRGPNVDAAQSAGPARDRSPMPV